MKFASLLETLSSKQLRKLYRRIASGPYRHEIPKWLAEKTLRHRCFLLFAKKFPTDTSLPHIEIYIERVLRTPFTNDLLAKTALAMSRPISKEEIEDMRDSEIDRLLVINNLQLTSNLPLATRKRILVELFFGIPKATRRRVSKMLTPMILKEPHLSYTEFYSKYSGIAPHISSLQFRDLKKRLRARGHKIPKLGTGPRKKLDRATKWE